jgi:hypothetical protein
MMQSKIFIAAAAIGAGVMFTAPQTFATPLTSAGTQFSTVAKQSTGVEQVATRYYKKKRWSHRRHWHNNRWAGRYRYHRRYAGCWNCGGRYYRYHHRHHYGAPFYLSFGYPYYPYYDYGYPYGYPYGYGYGPGFGVGFRFH